MIAAENRGTEEYGGGILRSGCSYLASVGTVFLAFLGMLGTGAAPVSSAAMTASPANFNRETYSYSTKMTTAQEAGRYQIMVLQSTDAAAAAALKAANPRLKVLMYQAAIHSVTSDPAGLITCTPYGADNSSNAALFLKDQYGNRIVDKSYSSAYLMDVGNPSYEQSCASHAASLALQDGFDGVYLDGLNAQYNWLIKAGVKIPKYPTTSAWQAAMYSLITTVAGQLHSHQLLVAGNIGGSTGTAGLWQKWTTPMDGSEEESWTDGGAGLAQQIPFWAAKLANVVWSEANGKYALLHSYNTSETGNTYGLASMMLVAGGSSSYSTSGGVSSELWFPEYSTAQQLGPPSAHYTKMPNGVYERQFANGLVLVNPSANATQTISLGGGIYSGSQLNNVTSVAMGPTSGLILIRVG
jgi:hypothetical protein